MRRNKVLLFILASATVAAILLSSQYTGISIPNASAVTADSGIGVYWDQAATNSCQSIYWGRLTPGSNRTMVVYVKNEGYDPVFYSLAANRWNPINASNYMTLHSDYDGSKANPGSVTQVSLTLSVSPEIVGISDFSFDIVIKGNYGLLGDVNHDGKVGLSDALRVTTAYGSSPSDSNWDADADLNGDGIVDMLDVNIVIDNFGITG